MKLINNGWFIIIGLLVSVTFLIISSINACKREQKPILAHTDTIHGDSVPVYITINKPFPYIKIKYQDTGSFRIIHDTVKVKEIIGQYYTRNVYKRIFKDDSSALVMVEDTVFKNELQGSGFTFQNRRPTVINTYMVGDKPRNRFYIGAVVGGNLKYFDFGPAALFVTKRNLAAGYHYEVLDKRHFLTFYWTWSKRH